MHLSRRAFLASEAASGPLEAGGPGYAPLSRPVGRPCRKPPSPSPRWEAGGLTLCPAQPPPVWALSAHLRAGQVLPKAPRLRGDAAARMLPGRASDTREACGHELLQGMGAGKLDRATGAVALSPDCGGDSSGS